MFKVFKKSNPSALIGIDFGSSAIKAIALSKIKGNFQIDAVAEIAVEKGVIVDHRFEDMGKLTEIIKRLHKNFPASHQNVAIAVSGADVITKVIPMNTDLNDLALEYQVEIEAENSIPFPLDEIFLDFEIIGSNANNPDFKDVLVSAARKDTVLSQVSCIEKAGLQVQIVDIASHALARAFNLLFSSEDFDKGIAVVDIGASEMTLNILHQGQVIFSRTKNHGGAVCTQMIADRYGLKLAEAEKIKVERDWPLDCNIDVLAPFITMTVNHLRFDLRMFTNAPKNIDVAKIMLTGGCQLLPGLADQIQEQLDFETEIVNPFLGFEYKNPSDKNFLHQFPTKYMMALGLALRGQANV
ncbi:MAG: type IV pilus assembly protein PilM [Psychromonas sp.]|jgi:type IV pilus assembly protein PilM